MQIKIKFVLFLIVFAILANTTVSYYASQSVLTENKVSQEKGKKAEKKEELKTLSFEAVIPFIHFDISSEVLFFTVYGHISDLLVSPEYSEQISISEYINALLHFVIISQAP